MATSNPYPARVTFEYPETLNRGTTAVRIFMWLPVAIMIALLTAGGGSSAGAGGGLLLAIAAAILFRGYIPHWVFNFQVAFMQFGTRATAYLALLTDRYPAFESEYPVNLEIDYPEHLTRWKVIIWKFITAIPHFIILIVLGIAAIVVVVIAWFAILITGKYPESMFRFVSGVIRWSVRVEAYVYSLTDEYPPFSVE